MEGQVDPGLSRGDVGSRAAYKHAGQADHCCLPRDKVDFVAGEEGLAAWICQPLKSRDREGGCEYGEICDGVRQALHPQVLDQRRGQRVAVVPGLNVTCGSEGEDVVPLDQEEGDGASRCDEEGDKSDGCHAAL